MLNKSLDMRLDIIGIVSTDLLNLTPLVLGSIYLVETCTFMYNFVYAFYKVAIMCMCIAVSPPYS